MPAARLEGHLSVTQVSRLCEGGGICYPQLVRLVCEYYGVPIRRRSGVGFIALDQVRRVQLLICDYQGERRRHSDIRHCRRKQPIIRD
jgi:hypothetical protein